MASNNESKPKFPSVPVTRSEKLKFLKKLGCGRFGVVTKERHKDWGIVAVKKIIDAYSVPDKVEEKLMKEVDKIKLLGHENIINVYGVIMEENNYAIILKYMENGCLQEFLERERVGWPLKTRMIKEIILGMNYLHKIHPKAIIHRDLKSQNILVDRYIHIKISDFGISDWITYSRQYSVKIGETNNKKGTVTHIPPESWADINCKPNCKFDVYSFAILIWEILSERAPFEGADTPQVSECVQRGQRPDEETIMVGAPEFLIKIMRKCWDQKAEERPTFSHLNHIMDEQYAPYDSAAEKEAQDLINKQLRFERLNSNVEEDTARLASLNINDAPRSIQETGEHDHHSTQTDYGVHSRQGNLRSPIQRNTTEEPQPNAPRFQRNLPVPVERNALTEDGSAETAIGISPTMSVPRNTVTSAMRDQPDGAQASHRLATSSTNLETDAAPCDSNEGNKKPTLAAAPTHPFDPKLGYYLTGPDTFPGQHVPDPDGKGYLYYPMPNMAPIHIDVPPNPAVYRQQQNQPQPTARNNSAIVHHHKNGSTTNIFNLNGFENIQIGDSNVIRVSGSTRPRSTLTKNKVVKTKPVQVTESTRKITDEDISIVARHLGKDWKFLGRQLGMTDGQIDGINHDYQADGLLEKIYQMLRSWRTNRGSEATAKFLANALLKIRRNDVACRIPK